MTSQVQSESLVRLVETHRPWTDAFRASASLAIACACVHYALHAPADFAAVPPQTTGHELSSLLAAALRQLSPSGQWLLAAALAGAVVFGLAPRISAAALAAVLGSRPAVAPLAAGFDVPVMSLISVWLVILPAGARYGLVCWATSAFERSHAVSSRCPRWTVELCRCSVAAVYMNVYCWRSAFPHWDVQPIAALMPAGIVSLSLLAPTPRWHYLTMTLQIGFHLALAAVWGHAVGNLLLATTGILQLDSAASSGESPRVDASVACATTMIVTIVLFVTAQVFGFATLVQTAGSVLSNLGPLVSLYALS